MPRLDLNLSSINRHRDSVTQLQSRQRDLDFKLADQEAALTQAEQGGASPNLTTPLRQRIAALRAERQDLSAQLREHTRAVDSIANGLLGDIGPARMVEALDGNMPIALLPMRLETRYVREGTALRIRVYPDDLNIIEHTPALTEKERLTGTQYWEARFRADQDEADRLARDLALRAGRSRCAWVLRVLTPENMDQAGQEGMAPRFPDLPLIDARSKQTRALLLPDRWCAIGYGAGRHEVFRVWGQRIPDELVLTPDWTSKDEPEALLDGERAWLADFDKAVENGMALEVTQQAVDMFARQHHALPFRLATHTLERLIVVGLEWSKDAQQSAEELSDLLAAQRDSSGLGFLHLGTPTNNTESARSGYSASVQRTPPLTPSENAQLPKERDALQLLVEAFGLDDQRMTADGVEHAHLCEQRTSMHMLNALWRGSFGHYLMELWNPPGEEKDRVLKTPALYALRRYAVSYLRPVGPMPLLRVGKQPYGILPVVGKGFVPDLPIGIRILRDPEALVESNVGKVLGVLRPLWEQAGSGVPLLKDGSVDKAKDILQTSPWSQAAYYRNVDNLCLNASPVFDVSGTQQPTKGNLITQLFAVLGVKQDVATVPMYNCASFPPDPPYSAGSLAGVPWVLADAKQATQEAAPESMLPDESNYLKKIAQAIGQNSAGADPLLSSYQTGPNLLQALVSYSVQMERHDAAQSFALGTSAVKAVFSVAQPRMVNIEVAYQNEAVFQVTSPQQLASVVIPGLTGQLTLGDYVAHRVAAVAPPAQAAGAFKAGTAFVESIAQLVPALREVTGVKLSLEYLATRSVGELNVAFRSTLDAFSYRLDSWYTARASRRLEQLRERNARGVYVGGFAWVENLRADQRPDSEGYLLAPSQAQAASAALMRSGFMANHEQGAFNVQLDSRRVRRAQDILQGLTRDQPLAALYGYRIERGLRDAQLGKLIWPLRLAYPWHANDTNLGSDSHEAVGARDVVDGVALLDAWEKGQAAVWTRVRSVTVNGGQPFNTLNPAEQQAFARVIDDAMDLADSVSDLLMAEGTYQITQGNFDRASAAMAVIDKQTLPIETQVARTPRGGASYTQRVALLCPQGEVGNWPQDRRSRAEPALNAWLAHMLGNPARYIFSAVVHRGETPEGNAIVDADAITVSLAELGLSPITAVLAATSVTQGGLHAPAETGFRARLATALSAAVPDAQTVTGLDIRQDGAGSLGLAHFEAMASTLRGLLDKARPLTRKDLVVPADAIESGLPDEGEYPGVDLAELRARADALIADFVALKDAVEASPGADALLASLAAMEDFMPAASWPQEVVAIDTPGAPVASREERADLARSAAATLLQNRLDSLNAAITLVDGQLTATHAQRAQNAIDQVKLLLGKDFPVLPRFALGGYADAFNASLADQPALTQNNPWRVTEWLPQIARVREGVDRFSAALAAHETLVDVTSDADFRVVQYPHRDGHAWAALPEAWREADGVQLDKKQVPEELHAYLETRGGTQYKDINRAAPQLAIALHAPGGLDAVDGGATLAGMMCDEWPEFVPDPYQTAAIGFHYDAPGARPPQSILLAVPPRSNQENWTFDDVLDVLHEAWDLARLRAVRPKDLGAGLGLLLPGNYLPHDYTGDMPGVRALELARQALRNKLAVGKKAVFPLGKV